MVFNSADFGLCETWEERTEAGFLLNWYTRFESWRLLYSRTLFSGQLQQKIEVIGIA
jgi:hypothetical protein